MVCAFKVAVFISTVPLTGSAETEQSVQGREENSTTTHIAPPSSPVSTNRSRAAVVGLGGGSK